MLSRTFCPGDKGVPSSIRSRVHSVGPSSSSTNSFVLSAAVERRKRQKVTPICAKAVPGGGVAALAVDDFDAGLYLATDADLFCEAGRSLIKTSALIAFELSSSSTD